MYKIWCLIYFGGSRKFVVINWEITIIIRDIIEVRCCIDNQRMIQINVVISNEIQEDLNWNDKAQNCRYRLPPLESNTLYIYSWVRLISNVDLQDTCLNFNVSRRTIMFRARLGCSLNFLLWADVRFIRAESWAGLIKLSEVNFSGIN